MAVTHEVYDREGKLVSEELTPMKALRLKCMECSNWSPKEVKLCPISACPLYPYRFGKRPD